EFASQMVTLVALSDAMREPSRLSAKVFVSPTNGGRTGFSVCASQTLIDAWSLHTIRRPSGVIATSDTWTVWPAIGLPKVLLGFAFQMRMVLSLPPEMICSPSGLNATASTVSRCPVRGLPLRAADSASHIWIV